MSRFSTHEITEFKCRNCGVTLCESNTYPSVFKGLLDPKKRSLVCRSCQNDKSNLNYYANYSKRRIKQKQYYLAHRDKWAPSEHRRSYIKWLRDYSYDWLFLQLGNKCDWCGRHSGDIQLEIDHIVPVIRLKGHIFGGGPLFMIKEYLSGEELRLLCIQCHSIRHAL